MKILISTFGTRGDVQPYVALGAALRVRGHDVTVSTGQGFDDMITAQDLVAAPTSIDYRAILQTPEAQAALRTFSGKIRALRAFKGHVSKQHDDMWRVAQEVRPDVIVFHPKAYASQHIAEAMGIIAIPTTLQPLFVPTAEFPCVLLPFRDLGASGNLKSHQLLNWVLAAFQRPMLKKWRQTKLGLPADYTCFLFDGYDPRGREPPRLHAYSQQLVPKPDDWSEREHITGYWAPAPEENWEPPQDLAQFLQAGEPPVYIGFGSMPTKNARAQTLIVLNALNQTGQRAILATGWGGLESIASSKSIHVLDAAPHSWLFPRCCGVIHHGGAGTTHEALRWGRPSLVCPIGADQPFWARRVAEMGLGPEPVPQQHLKRDDLVAALAAFKDPEMLARCATAADAMRLEGGTAQSADLIEAFCAP